MRSIGLLRIFLLVMLGCSLAAAAGNRTIDCFNTEFDCICGGCPDNCDSPLYRCTTHGDEKPTCDHKTLLPLVWQDIMLFIILFIVLALSSAAGIGGGGLLIPLMLIICQFQPYYSVPLSVTSIVGGSIIRFLVQVPQFHPEAKHRRLINFPLVMLLLPSTLCGTVLGVLLNSVSPTWLVVSTIFFVLTYATYETAKKGMVLNRQERVRLDMAFRKAGNDDDGEALLNVLWPKSSQPPLEMLAADATMPNDDDDDALLTEEQQEIQRIKIEESRFPWRYLLASFAFLGILLFISLSKGGRSRKSPSFVGVECGSAGYVVLVCFQFALCFGCAAGTMVWVRRQFLRRVTCGYPFVKGDLYYTYTRVIVLPVCTVVAGFLAGFLGVGAGMIIGPFLLSLGQIPMVSAATTSYMTLFTSSSATVQYIALGRVLPSYGAFLFCLAAVASYVGQRFIVGPIKARNKTSLLVLMLAGIIGAAAILLCVTGGMQIKRDYDQGANFGFKTLCTA